MSFLDAIKTFNKSELAEGETRITRADGSVVVEKKSGEQVAAQRSAGFIVSDLADDGTGGGVELAVDYEEGLPEHTGPEVLAQRAAWKKERTSLSDGLECRCSEGAAGAPWVGVYVPEAQKVKHEKHFDTLCWRLHRRYNLRQVNSADIEGGALMALDAIVFPGGSIFIVAPSMSRLGRDKLLAWLEGGGAYVGICAGGFMATRDGFAGSDASLAVARVATSWTPGTGRAVVSCADAAPDVLGPAFLPGRQAPMFFANGPHFAVDPLPSGAQVVARYVSVDTEQTAGGPRTSFGGFDAAVVAVPLGSGRAVLFGPHPESSGDEWVAALARSLQWTMRK